MYRNLIAAAVIALAGSFAWAQQTDLPKLSASDAGKIQFLSANRGTAIDLLYKGKARYDETISGDLFLPSGTGKVPAMVVMHDSGGVGGATSSARAWASDLAKWGYATFIVDSFTPRGISATGADQSLLSYTTSGIDALKALEVLATHPRIDANRIGVIGFSRGAFAAQEASFEKFRAAVLPNSSLKFALHAVIYGGCTQYGTTTGVPILHLMGDKDGYNTAENCKRVTELINSKGGNVRLVVYPGGLHGFDRPEVSPRYLGHLQTWRNCEIIANRDDLTYQIPGNQSASFRELLDYRKSCMTTGSDYGGDSTYAAQAREEVKALLAKVFGQ